MHIKQIHLINYRNYTDFCVKLDDRVNFIIGRNAAGKTNLLEAAYFLDNGKSHRTGTGSEVIKWDEEFAAVRAVVSRRDREITLEAAIKRTGGRHIKINGVMQTPAQARFRPLIVVLFTPDHLKIVKETPEYRRAYLDEILEKIKPDYQYWRQQYSKVLKQRNVLLKRVFSGSMKTDVIDHWDVQLIQAGIKIIKARAELIERLQDYAGREYCKITGSNDSFTLGYENQIIDRGIDYLDKAYLDLISQKRKSEIERGQTLVGPHRDDVAMSVGDMDVRAYGSQGEQRSASLALKLAELSLVTDVVNDPPVLLLDDVMSELDEVRRQAMLQHLSEGQQVIITSANEKYLEDMNGMPAQVIRINHG